MSLSGDRGRPLFSPCSGSSFRSSVKGDDPSEREGSRSSNGSSYQSRQSSSSSNSRSRNSSSDGRPNVIGMDELMQMAQAVDRCGLECDFIIA